MFIAYKINSVENKAKPIPLTTDIELNQAVLDPASKGNKKDPVCLYAEYGNQQALVAVLDPSQWQTQLNLSFEAGTEVKFFIRGSGTIHLSGYEHNPDPDDMSFSMSSDEEDISDEEAQVMPAKKKLKVKAATPVVVNAKKSPKTNGVKPVPAKSNGKANGNKAVVEEPDDDDDDESDDEDFDEELSLNEEDDDDDDDEEGDDDDEEMDDDELAALGEDSDDDDDDE